MKLMLFEGHKRKTLFKPHGVTGGEMKKEV